MNLITFPVVKIRRSFEWRKESGIYFYLEQPNYENRMNESYMIINVQSYADNAHRSWEAWA